MNRIHRFESALGLDALALKGQFRRMPAASKRKSTPEIVDRGLEVFRNYLRDHNLKNSKVREEIARIALAHEGHFTVEDLLDAARNDGINNVHAATIYRAIPLMIDSGLLELALVSGGESQHYERAFEREHHDHLVCTQCGRVVEFFSETLEALQREIAERYGYRLDEHIHELRGCCSLCRRKEKTAGVSSALEEPVVSPSAAPSDASN